MPTINDIKDQALRRLGNGVVCTELTDDQVNDAVEFAKDWYAARFGNRKYSLMISTGEVEYDVPTDCDAVVEVVFELGNDALFDVFNWAGVQLGTWELAHLGTSRGGNWGVNEGYSGLVQAMQYLEQAKQILSAERDWDYDEVRRKLSVVPAPASGEKMMMYYLSTDIEVSTMRRNELLIFKDVVYAYTMQILANIRSKYGELPSASGSMTLNGSDLAANSESLLMTLDERARNQMKPVGFWAG